jgi:uncharacterized protein YndB with AHSA1/START domain
MNDRLVATVSTTINASSADVWQALVTPAAIERYMFRTSVISDWVVGSEIVWRSTWEGRAYEDKGIILQIVPERVLEYSHFSPRSGFPDVPENYHIVTVEISADGQRTHVVLSQDNNPTEQARDHAKQVWSMMLAALRQFVER